MVNHPNRSKRTRKEANALAKQLGCTLEYWKQPHGFKHVHIYLPEGMVLQGSSDCDVLHHECLPDEDIWPGVVDELRALIMDPKP